MENPEEILHSLEEFAKLKPKDIPRELEDYLCFVAKTGDPVYQWSAVKSLFREKLINVITEFYESCPSVEIPPCPNVEMFNYDSMKNFILEKLDTFASAPFTVQRICELLTTPRKEYNRIDKYMRALEKNILVVSTTEPGNRRSTENGEGIVNGIETEHLTEANSSSDINVEEMDDSPSWPRLNQQEANTFTAAESSNSLLESQPIVTDASQDSSDITTNESRLRVVEPSTSNADSVITCTTNEKTFVSIEPIVTESKTENNETETNAIITPTPAPVQKRRDSIEPITLDDNASSDSIKSDKEDTSTKEHEEKSDITSSEEPTESTTFEDTPVTKDTEEVKECNIEGKPVEEKPVSECVKTLDNVEETNDTISDNDTIATDTVKEDVSLELPPKNEPVNEEICDNTKLIDNVNNSIEKSNEQLPENTVDEIPKENIPSVESIELDSNEENVPLLNDVEEPKKQDNSDEVLLPTEFDEKSESVKEPILNDSPMDIDTDETLVKESSTEEANADTNTN